MLFLILLFICLCLSGHIHILTKGHRPEDYNSFFLLILYLFCDSKKKLNTMWTSGTRGTGILVTLICHFLCIHHKMISSQKGPNFTLLLAFKEASSFLISIQHTESSLCFYDQIKSVLTFLFLWVYFTSSYEDLNG